MGLYQHWVDRFLIQAMIIDYDGHVVCFKMHDVMCDVEICIAEEQENFYHRVHRGFT